MKKALNLVAAALLAGSCAVNANGVIDPAFDFRIDRDVTLLLESQPAGKGVVNVYFDYEHYDQNTGTYYPKYDTRVLSFHPSATNKVDIQINKNWQHLIVEFVPTEANGTELYQRVDLSYAGNQVAFSF